MGIYDVRGQVKELIQLERKRMYTRVRNDMVWQFVNPTELSQSPAIAKGLEEFAVLSEAVNPKYTPDLTKHAVTNEVIAFAQKLVSGGFATWKPDWDPEKVTQVIQEWQIAKNAVRLRNILDKDPLL